LEALGIGIMDSYGHAVSILPADSASWKSLNLDSLQTLKEKINIIVLCDVKNPLLGLNGAAAVFGPQKGASPAMVRQLESSLVRLRDLVKEATGFDMSSIPYGGAAGGIAATFHALLGAELVKGIDYFLHFTDFDSSLAKAQWVITGEGRIDRQTLEGKAPIGVALRARKKSIPILVLAGDVPDPHDSHLNAYFNEIVSINKKGEDLDYSITHTADHLKSAARDWGNRMAMN
jgi:glycerate kinase